MWIGTLDPALSFKSKNNGWDKGQRHLSWRPADQLPTMQFCEFEITFSSAYVHYFAMLFCALIIHSILNIPAVVL